MVVILLRSVDGNAYQPMVLCKEFTPFISEKCTISLDDVINLFSVGVFFLKRQRFLVEIDGSHQRLTSMPSEKHLRHGLCLDVLSGELLQHLIAHQMAVCLAAEVCFLRAEGALKGWNMGGSAQEFYERK